MKLFDRGFRDMFLSQIVSLIGGLAAGTMLAIYTDEIFLIPGIFIILPGFLEMRGNISGSFASRLSSGLFLGVIDPKRTDTKLVRGNVVASFFIAVAVSLSLGLLAFFFNWFVFGIFMLEIVLLPVVAAVIANLIEVPLTLLATFYLFRKGHDPNNIMGPFITSTGDITSIVSLLLAMVAMIGFI
jgi:mgtE-like transporter